MKAELFKKWISQIPDDAKIDVSVPQFHDEVPKSSRFEHVLFFYGPHVTGAACFILPLKDSDDN